MAIACRPGGYLANINSTWKRFVAIGCSHGHLEDRTAINSVLKFCSSYKPHTRIHLGDAFDTTAFRSGAHGTKDEAEKIGPDLNSGLRLLEDFAPTHYLIGNHELRIYRDMNHPHAIRAHAAGCMINDIRSLMNKLNAKFVEHYDINRSWITLGDTKFMHGFLFSEAALRDHAEIHGRLVMAHLHRVGMEPGRVIGSPMAYCVGTLANISKLEYASTRRSTTRWSQGFAWGEYNDKRTIVRLEERGHESQWRLPL